MKIIPIAKEAERKPANALGYLLDAWDEAAEDGVKADALATASLFLALSTLVETHGEEAVSALAERLSKRIQRGEFTVARSPH
jgi:hypothetical protein